MIIGVAGGLIGLLGPPQSKSFQNEGGRRVPRQEIKKKENW